MVRNKWDYFDGHVPSKVSPRRAVAIQLSLKKRVSVLSVFKRLSQIKTLASFDAAYNLEKNEIYGAGILFSFPGLELIEKCWAKRKLTFPYIPGLLTFREGPVLLDTYRKFKEKPDLLVFDGQGITHPRKLGEATHLGIILNRPSIGCAKSNLWGSYEIPENVKGSFSYILGPRGKKLGAVIRTRRNVKPIFVSPGYKISLDLTIGIILACLGNFRLPEPMRLVHQFAERHKNAAWRAGDKL